VPFVIALACNDHRNGVPLGYAEAITIEGIRLVGGRVVAVNFREQPTRRATAHDGLHTLCIGRLKIPALGYKRWYGNWVWDAASVRPLNALSVINYLAAKPDWFCEEGESTLFRAFNRRRVITREEWASFAITVGLSRTHPRPALI
jgi:hypothetical protein